MGDNDSRLTRGEVVRREVLGDAHVNRSMAKATEFSRVVQEYVTTTCWGDVWSRPGLDRRTRSLLNLAMLTALNRPHEFAVHVRGALRNGCTVDDIQETLLQTAPYCGAPAALESFRVAERTIDEVRQEAAAKAAGPAAAGAAAEAAEPAAVDGATR